MNPWIPHLLRAGGGGGGAVLPPTGRTMLANLTSSLILGEGTGDPTWSRATKAWCFNELGYLEELASGCAFFGGARLVRNLATKSETFTTGWSLGRTAMPVDGKLLDSVDSGTHRMYFTAATPGPGAYMAWFEVKAAEWSKCAVGVHSNTESGGVRVLFNLSTGVGEFHAGLIDGSFTSTLLADGWVKVIVRGNLTSTSIGVFLYTANDSGVTNYVGDGTKGILVRKAMVCDVTNYDASYIPEYVSVGVEASPYFGAGIDGAKYFETDWQGAPIAAANLLGFRREAAATNNILRSRRFHYTVNDTITAGERWVSPNTVGAELIVNGGFDADTDWAKSSGWTIGAGVATAVAVTDGSIRQTVSGVVPGNTYTVTYTVTRTAGRLTPNLGSSTENAGTPVTASGTHTTTMRCGATSVLYFYATSAFSGTLDNVSIKEAAVQISDATGLGGIANTATTLTATAADAIILQPITLASAARCASAYVKRRTGTGTISFTQDGGSTWTDITSQINSSTWSRVQITSTLADPSTGFKISTSGDAIDVDCVQNEAGAVATSPIVTTTAAVTRNADSLTYQTAGNIDLAVGTVYSELLVSSASIARRAVYVGSVAASYVDGSSTVWKAYDGTNTVTKNGLSDASTAKRKRVVTWGTGMSVTGDGLTPASGSFDGSFGAATTIDIGNTINGYIGPVAIYNYQMTDAELQALTT